MKIGILGSGMVAQAHAERLIKLGYEVMVGSRDKETLLTAEWIISQPTIKVGSYEEAADYGEIIFEALKGEVAIETTKKLESLLSGKIMVDIANPLDFSKGMPPTLSICNTDSLGEQIQNYLPKTKIVKTFNTMSASLQVNPQLLNNGDHTIFISGNDADAKNVIEKIMNEYGWKNIIDLGDITTARATEMILPIWLRLWGSLQTQMFNLKVVN